MNEQSLQAINCDIKLAPTTVDDHIAIIIPRPAAIMNMAQALELSCMLEKIVEEYTRDTWVDLNHLRAEEAA